MRHPGKVKFGKSGKAYSRSVVSIHIGEYYVTSNPVVIRTFLGSCVAACLFDPVNNIGGMNHILIPGSAKESDTTGTARYSFNSMKQVLDAMLELGANREKIVAKIFGGASVIPEIPEKDSVGHKIISNVKDFLSEEEIQIVKSDLGGDKSRKVYFHTDNGAVYLQRKPSYKTNVIESEKLSRRNLLG